MFRTVVTPFPAPASESTFEFVDLAVIKAVEAAIEALDTLDWADVVIEEAAS